MQAKTIAQLIEIRQLLIRGLTHQEIADSLRISRRTVVRNVPKLSLFAADYETKEAKKVLRKYIASTEESLRDAWIIVSKAKADSAKVAALRLIDDIQINRIKILQSTGYVREAPKLIDMQVQENSVSIDAAAIYREIHGTEPNFIKRRRRELPEGSS